MRQLTPKVWGVFLACLLSVLWVGPAVGAPHPTWNGDYQRTSFRNISLSEAGPYAYSPTHRLWLEGGLFSYSAPVFDDRYMYVYLYDQAETAYIRAYSLEDIFTSPGDREIPYTWQVRIPSFLSRYGNSRDCLRNEEFAHCGDASAVSAPSLYKWNGRTYLGIGIGARFYIMRLGGGEPEVFTENILNSIRPGALHQVSASPAFAGAWVFVGSWQGVFKGWKLDECFEHGVADCRRVEVNADSIGLSGNVITSSPSVDTARNLIYWGTDPSGHLFAVRADGQPFSDGKPYRILTQSRWGISSSVVVAPNGWIYWPDKVGYTYRMDPDTGQRYEAYCGTSAAARQGSPPRTIRNIAVAQHGVYAISDNRRTLGRLPLDFSSSAGCVLFQTDGPEFSSPVATADGVVVAFRGPQDQYGYSFLMALAPDFEWLPVFRLPSGTSVFLAYRSQAIADFQAPVIDVGEKRAIAVQFPNSIEFWTPVDMTLLTLSINGDPNWRKLIEGNTYTLNVVLRNPTEQRTLPGRIQVDLGGSRIGWAHNTFYDGHCWPVDSQRAECEVAPLGPGATFQANLPIVAISTGQQTIVAQSDVRPEGAASDRIDATLPVEIISRPWAQVTYRDSPFIEHHPPYPSTTREGGRVRAQVEYARTGEKLVTTDTRSRSGHTCVARRETEYTAGIRVTYRYVDVDGSDLLWYSDVLRREVGKGEATPTTPDGKPVSDPQNHPRLIWHAPEVGFRYEGIGEVHFEVVEDRRIRIERWDCRENYEPIYEWRDTDGDGIEERVRVGERFVGYTRTPLPTEYRDAQDIRWTDWESISIASVGTIRNR